MRGNSRQVTLQQSWGVNQLGPTPPSGPSPSFSVAGSAGTSSGGRGRRRGRGGRPHGNSAGVSVRVRGGGRGRRRGTTTRSPAQSRSTTNFDSFQGDEEADDDALCLQALSNFEWLTNDVSQAFVELNDLKQLPGFDRIAGDSWIYPTNRPVRNYQFSIVETALFHNTMVCLPTGLGKTFIAAVVMYNFHRWYPNNLIIFMAPTKPLVTQQLDACRELVGIDPSKMIELTGQISPKRREELWKEKKVFFLTPQVFTSDLSRGSCFPAQVRCIVVDEAHKTLGNHAYTEAIQKVIETNKCFRILALSATPGNDLLAVKEVLHNLFISKVELRSETSADILPYTHQKEVETIIVPLDDHINRIHKLVMEIYQKFIEKLRKQNALFGREGASFTQFQILKAREAYRQNQKSGVPNYQKGFIELDFATCISLAHATDLLLTHGLRCFYSFLNGVLSKEKGTPAVTAQLKKVPDLESILEEVREKLNILDENSFFDLSASGLFTTSNPSPEPLAELKNPDDYLLSHPKMRVLRDIVEEHFTSDKIGSRIIIFSEYRDSVQEIGNMLNALRPLVKPMIFVGQNKSAGVGGRGLRQKEQGQVIQSFQSGDFNVLISTCVGEEGLDIGEVDLIICFDCGRSPTRLVQRMGRTGRQREGKTIFLLTEGRERGGGSSSRVKCCIPESTSAFLKSYFSSLHQQRNISKTITDVRLLDQFLYKESPRMVPADVLPQCFKMNIILSSEQKLANREDVEVIEIDNVQTLKNKERASTSKHDEPGSIFKRRFTPTPRPADLDPELNYEVSPKLSKVSRKRNERRSSEIEILPGSPEIFPPSPIFANRRGQRLGLGTKSVSVKFQNQSEVTPSKKPHYPESRKIFPPSPPPSQPEPPTSLPSSDTSTFYESDHSPCNNQLELSPVLSRRQRRNRDEVEVNRKLLFGNDKSSAKNVAKSPEIGPEQAQNSTLSSEILPDQFTRVTPKRNSNDIADQVEIEQVPPKIPEISPNRVSTPTQRQPESFQMLSSSSGTGPMSAESSPSTFHFETNGPRPKKLFTFRKRGQSTSTPLVSFKELRHGFSQLEMVDSSIPIQSLPLFSSNGNTLSTHPLQNVSPTRDLLAETYENQRTVLMPWSSELPIKNAVLSSCSNQQQQFSPSEFETEGTKGLANNSSDSDAMVFIPNAMATTKQSVTGVPNTVYSNLTSISNAFVDGTCNTLNTPYPSDNGPGSKRNNREFPERKRRRIGTGFILDEAEVEGSASSDENENEWENLDAFENNSFVAVEESPDGISESQQVRYMASTKDTPKRQLGKRKSLDEIAMERLERTDDPDRYLEDYDLEEEEGTFCVPNDYIEYEAFGDFTQRMDEARLAVQFESPSSRFKKNLRSTTRREQEVGDALEFKAPFPAKQRKRILVVSSSSSDSD